MQLKVKYVDDADLPPGHLWMVCATRDVTRVFMARSVRSMSEEDDAAVRESLWAGARALRFYPFADGEVREMADG